MNRLFAILIIGFIIFSGLLPSHAESVDLSKAEEERRIGHLLDLYMTESFVMLRDDELYEKISDVIDRIAEWETQIPPIPPFLKGGTLINVFFLFIPL
ncbi:MAG: hypothetical protein ACW98X_25925 [Promethearchaeota archaeon]|jgi:hypothetical protein